MSRVVSSRNDWRISSVLASSRFTSKTPSGFIFGFAVGGWADTGTTSHTAKQQPPKNRVHKNRPSQRERIIAIPQLGPCVSAGIRAIGQHADELTLSYQHSTPQKRIKSLSLRRPRHSERANRGEGSVSHTGHGSRCQLRSRPRSRLWSRLRPLGWGCNLGRWRHAGWGR